MSVGEHTDISWISGRSIADSDLRHDANTFTLIRCLLACAVMFSHAFDITGRTAEADPSRFILPFTISRLAVLLFFSLSGFLVAGSLIKRGVAEFCLARALRLVPGLWVMLAVTSLLIGILFRVGGNPAPVSIDTLRHYILYNTLLLGREYTISGSFIGNPLPTLVNGSLWTIPQEVRCYAVLVSLSLVGLLRSPKLLAAGFLIYFVVDMILPANAVLWLSQPRPLALAFFFGVLLYLWRDRVVLSWQIAIIAVVGSLALRDGVVAEAVTGLTCAYFMMVAAIMAPSRLKAWSSAMPDYSYGIYIYGFPAQQAAFALGWGTSPYSNLAASLALVLPISALSWHLVEKPCLALKPRLTRVTARIVTRRRSSAPH